MVLFQALDPCVSGERRQTNFIIVQIVLQNTASSFFKRMIIGWRGEGGGGWKQKQFGSSNVLLQISTPGWEKDLAGSPS